MAVRAWYGLVMGLSALEQSALGAFRARLDVRFGERLARVVLFGSRARGEGHEESDLDVLVLVRGLTREERRAAIDDAGEVEMATGLIVSALVRDAETWGRADGPLARAVEREGIAL
jgi:predicted nucleotidyltransferase